MIITMLFFSLVGPLRRNFKFCLDLAPGTPWLDSACSIVKDSCNFLKQSYISLFERSRTGWIHLQGSQGPNPSNSICSNYYISEITPALNSAYFSPTPATNSVPHRQKNEISLTDLPRSSKYLKSQFLSELNSSKGVPGAESERFAKFHLRALTRLNNKSAIIIFRAEFM